MASVGSFCILRSVPQRSTTTSVYVPPASRSALRYALAWSTVTRTFTPAAGLGTAKAIDTPAMTSPPAHAMRGYDRAEFGRLNQRGVFIDLEMQVRVE